MGGYLMTKKKKVIICFVVFAIILLAFLPRLIRHFKMYLELREIKDPVVYSQYSDKYIFGIGGYDDFAPARIYIQSPSRNLFNIFYDNKYFKNDPQDIRAFGKRVEFNLREYMIEIEKPFTIVKIKNQNEYDMLNLPQLDSSEVSNSLSNGEDMLYIGYNDEYIYVSFVEPPSAGFKIFDRYTGKRVTGLKDTEYTSEVDGYSGGWTFPEHIISQDGHLFVIYKKHYKLFIRQLN